MPAKLIAAFLQARSAHPRLSSAARLVLAIALVGLVVWLVLVPEFGAARNDFGRLALLPPGLVVAAALLEIASLLTFSLMTRAVLDRPTVPYRRLLAVDLADLAANHTLPGGGATAAAIRYRLLRSQGITARHSIGTATIETALSNVALGLVFATGAVFMLGNLRSDTFIAAGIVAVVLVALAAAAGWALVRRPDASLRVVGRLARRIPFIGAGRAEKLVGELSEALTHLIADRRRATVAIVASLGNWLLDAAALWVMVTAFGQVTNPAVVLTAYGIGTILAQLPLTPGGLGIVEGATTVALVGMGVGHGPALLGVLGWRVLEYWLPTPIGWLCYLYLRVRSNRARRPVTADRAVAR